MALAAGSGAREGVGNGSVAPDRACEIAFRGYAPTRYAAHRPAACGRGPCGKPLSPYLEFPPQTYFITHAVFSWHAFAWLGTVTLLLVAALFFLLWRTGRRFRHHCFPFLAGSGGQRWHLWWPGYWHGVDLTGLCRGRLIPLRRFGCVTSWLSMPRVADGKAIVC